MPIELHGFLEAVFVSPPTRGVRHGRLPGAETGLTPNALMHNLKHNKVLHEHNLFVTVQAPRGAVDRLRQAAPRSRRWATTAGR